MKRRIARGLLCIAFLAPTFGPGLAIAAEKQENAFKEAEKQDLRFDGSISAIDTNAATVIIQHKQRGPMTFSFAKDAMFFVKHKKGAASLSDFKVGETVRVLYRQENGTLVCHGMWQPGANPSEKEGKIEKQGQTAGSTP